MNPTTSLALLASLHLASTAAAQCPIDHIRASDFSAHAGFGEEVAADGSWVLVGANYDDEASYNAGAAYFFEYRDGALHEVQKVIPPASEWSQNFGESVAIDGNLALIGSRDSRMAFQSGAGFLYRRTPDGWQLEDTLFPDEPVHAEQLGYSVALEGSTAVLGGAGHSSLTARAFVFEKDRFGWRQADELDPGALGNPTTYGRRVKISGDWIAVSGVDTQSAIYMFQRHVDGWRPMQRLTEDNGITTGLALLDMEGTRIVGGRSSEDPPAVLMFDLADGVWTAGQRLHGSGDPYITFGRAADLNGDRLAIGGDDQTILHTADEYVEVFRLEGDLWVSEGPVYPHPDAGAVTDTFGEDLEIWGDTLLVGTPHEYAPGSLGIAGALHVFNLERQTELVCQGTPNSTGFEAGLTIGCGSTPSELELRAAPVPDVPGLFFYGDATVNVPSWDGIRCVGGTIRRLPVAFASAGALETCLDLEAGGAPGLAPGSTWNIQAWYRDSAAGGTGANFSQAVRVTLGSR